MSAPAIVGTDRLILQTLSWGGITCTKEYEQHIARQMRTMSFLAVIGRTAVLIGSAPAVAFLLTGASGPATLDVTIARLRNSQGLVRICLSPNPAYFLKCETDPDARKLSLPAGQVSDVRFVDIAPGRYTLSVIHDENANGKLDKFLLIPKEGFGFSRNPSIRMGPPNVAEVEFSVGAGYSRQTVKIHYLL